jgi:hypothetical protein
MKRNIVAVENSVSFLDFMLWESSGYIYSGSRLVAYLLHFRNKTSSLKHEETFHEYRKKKKIQTRSCLLVVTSDNFI